MKKLLIVTIVAITASYSAAFAGFGFGLPNVTRNQVKEIDKKVEAKIAEQPDTPVVTLVSISVTPASPSVAAGSTKQFAATGNYSDATTKTLTSQVTWGSSDTGVATINSSGLATAVSSGTTSISAATSGITGRTTMTVTSTTNDGTVPGAFSLTSMTNGYTSAATLPTFQWGTSTDAVSYTLEVSTSSAFGETDVINETGLTSTSYTLTTTLNKGNIYYWRVTAVNTSGSTVASNAPFWFSVPVPAGTNANYAAVTPDGTKLYVTNYNSPGTVTVLSLAGHSITTTVTVGNYPAGIAIMYNGSKAFVANSNGGTISFIDLSNNTVSSTNSTGNVADTLYDIAVSPGDDTIYFGGIDAARDGLKMMNIAIPLPNFVSFEPYAGPFGVAVTPDGTAVLTTNGVTGTSIKKMAVGTNTLTTILNTSSSFGVAISTDGTEALVTSGQSGTVKRISLVSNTVTDTINFESNQSPHNIAITPDGTTAVVAGDFSVGLISLSDNSVTTYSGGGANVAITPDSKRAYVTGGSGSGSAAIRVIRIKE